MDPGDESALLRRFCEEHSDDAFAALVARHVNLVYSVALRQVGNAHQAEEITQAVFIILAKKAGGLRHDKALSSWLFQTTHLTVRNFIRSELRRRRREQEAHMQSMLQGPETCVWEKISPLLDSAVAALAEKDRRAIVLRFYENRNLRDVGVALGLSEEAAKKRVARALEKLERYFNRQGIASPADGIAAAISGNSIQAASASLAGTATAAALAKSAAPASTMALVKGALNAMAWAKAKVGAGIAAGILLAAGGTALFFCNASLASIDGTFRSVIFKHRYETYAQRFVGVWEGTMSILMNSSGRTEYRRIVVRIARKDGDYHALVDEVDAGLKNALVPTMTLDQLAINFKSDSFSYHGVFHKNATEIRGVWRGRDGGYLLVLQRTNAPDLVPPPIAKEDYTPRAGSAIQGLWKCVLTNGPAPQQAYLKVAEASDGRLRVEWNNVSKLPVVGVPVVVSNYIGSHVHFLMDSIGGAYLGDLQNTNMLLTGKWKQSSPFTGTKVFHLDFTRVNPDDEEDTLNGEKNFTYTSDKEIQGHWTGVFPPTFGVPLNLRLNVANLGDGHFSATLDSLDQLLTAIPVDTMEYKPPKVRLEVKSAHCSFEGKLENNKLSGTWTWNDASEPMTFERSAE
jgi:RNA polymerase sigma factor (sigma-70 family)